MAVKPSNSKETPRPAAPERERGGPRRRGLIFWAMLAVSVLLGLALLLYVGALGAVRLGFFDQTAASQLSRLFGAPARVGSIRASGVDLRVEKIAIDSRDKGKPLTVGAVTVDWDIPSLLKENRIRSVVVEDPSMELRRGIDGKWNFELQPAPGAKGQIAVDQLTMTGGDLALEWSPGCALRLRDLSATFADHGALAPSPFSLQGALESTEPFTVSGSIGPGAIWNGRLYGSLLLERDVATLGGLKAELGGKLHYDFSLNRDAATKPEQPALVRFDGRVSAEKFHWKFSPESSLASDHLPPESLDIHGRAGLDAAGERVTISDLQLRSDRIGSLTGEGEVRFKPDFSISLKGCSGQTNFEALNNVFEPPLLGGNATLEGPVEIAGLYLDLPLGRDAGPFKHYSLLAIGPARMEIRGLGELPPISAKAMVDWPALKELDLKIGDAAGFMLSLDSIVRSEWLDLARGTKIQSFHADLARLCESDFGRRLLTGNPGKPLLDEVPLLLKGALEGAPIEVRASAPGEPETVSLHGLSVSGLRAVKWPLPLELPAGSFSGEIIPSVKIASGAPQEIVVSAKIQQDADPQPTPLAGVEILSAFARQADGAWKPRPLELRNLSLPLSEIARMVKLPQDFGFSASSVLHADTLTVDPVSGEFSGTISISDAALSIPIPAQVREGLIQAVKASGYSQYAQVADLLPLKEVLLTKINSRFELQYKDRRFTLRGQTGPVNLAVKAPPEAQWLVGELQAVQISQVEISLDVKFPPDGSPSYTLHLELPGGKCVNVVVGQIAAEKWIAVGDLVTAPPGAVITTDTECDARFNLQWEKASGTLGPAGLSITTIPLALLGKALEQDWTGEIRDLSLEIAPFSIDAATRTISGQLKGNLARSKFSIRSSVPGENRAATSRSTYVELKDVNGSFDIRATANNGAMGIDALLQLDSYAVALAGGRVSIPPPAPGRKGTFKCTGKVESPSQGCYTAKLDKCELNLGGQIVASAEGTISTAADGSLSALDLPRCQMIAQDAALLIKGADPTKLAGINGAMSGQLAPERPRGPRALKLAGALRVPVLNGELTADSFNVSGISGPETVYGISVRLRGKETAGAPNSGIDFAALFKSYPGLGNVALRANVSLKSLEATEPRLEGARAFVFDIDSIDTGKKDEYWYDGQFAMSLNYPLVRSSFPSIFSDDYIRKLTFGVRNISLQYELRDGELWGPRGKLPGNLIIEGYGAEINPFAKRFKKDIKGEPKSHMPWPDVLREIGEIWTAVNASSGAK